MAWEFFHYANLARNGLIRFGNGRITVTNLRVFFFDVDTMNGLANELYLRLGLDEARNLVYEVSKKGGGRAAKAEQVDLRGRRRGPVTEGLLLCSPLP